MMSKIKRDNWDDIESGELDLTEERGDGAI